MKKVLSMLCVLAMMLGVVAVGTSASVSAASENGFLWSRVMGSEAAIYGYNGTQTELVIPSTLGGYPVTQINYAAFENNTAITGVTIPNTVTWIDAYAFRGCTSLANITLPDGVTGMEEAFHNTAYYNNEANWEDGALYIGHHLIAVKSTAVGAYAIRLGTKTIGGGALKQCATLTSVTIPDGVIYIGPAAFSGCKGLTSVTIPDGVTTLGYEAFKACTALEKITIPNSVKVIHYNAFFDCTSLKSVRLPDDLKTVGDWVFDGCKSLTSVTIPSGVYQIGEFAFNRCTALSDVYYTGSEAQWSAITIGSCNEAITNATIHYDWIEEEADEFDDVLLGDLNGDARIDMRDAFLVYRVVSGVDELTDAQRAVTDMNADDKINMRDAFALYKIASGG